MLFNEKTNPNCLVFDADGRLITFPITGDTATGIVSCLPLIDDENAIGPLNGLPVLMAFKAPLFIVPRHTAKPWTGYTFARGNILMIAPCPKCGWMIE